MLVPCWLPRFSKPFALLGLAPRRSGKVGLLVCYFCLTLVFRIFGEHKQRLMMAITVMSIVLLLVMVMMTTMIAVTIMDDYAPARRHHELSEITTENRIALNCLEPTIEMKP